MVHLLVVDDEPDILATLVDGLPLLVAPPFVVHGAASGEEAVAFLELHPQVDVVLCDARMPGMSGLEVLAWMQRTGHPGKRFLMTAYNLASFPRTALAAARLDGFCQKPVDFDVLVKTLGLAGPGGFAVSGMEQAPRTS